MSITSYLANKSNMITKRCEELVDEIYTEYKSGELTTELDYMYKAKNTIKDFYSNIGKPSFEYSKAISTPISNHYNHMVNKAYNDINLSILETEALYEAIKTSFDEVESNVATYSGIVKKVDSELNVIENNIKSLESESQYVFSDSFDSLDYIRNLANKDSVNIRQTEGVITLSFDNEKDYTNIVGLEILEGSNGFPGNTHEIETLNNKINFIGQNDARIELSNTLDQKKNTWFEYEIYNINDDVYEKTNGFGFEYKENLTWVTKGDELILRLKLYLNEEKVCNWVSLTPYIPSNKNSQPCIITNVVITDGNFLTQEFKPNKEFKDSYVINFEPQPIKEVIVDFKQKSNYETQIGHIYTIKNNSSDLFFNEIQDEKYKRIDMYKPSVKPLGIKHDPNTNTFILPKYTGDKSPFNQNALSKEIFSTPFDYGDFQSDIESIKAYRYSIGIKNIIIGNYTYTKSSVYVSKKFETNENITFVELEAQDFIPEDFKEFRADKDMLYTGEEFLKYEITFDEGNNWYPIMPKHRVRFYPCAYSINSDILPSMRKTANVRFIERFLDTKSITVRITLNRPEELIYDTPIVYNYKLNIKTEGDDFIANN